MYEAEGTTATAGPTPDTGRPAGPAGLSAMPVPTAVRRWHRRKWQESSKIERVDSYSHLTLSLLPWFLLIGWSGLSAGISIVLNDRARATLPMTLIILIFTINTAQCVLCNRQTRKAVDRYLGRGEFSTRRLLPAALLMTLALALDVVLQSVQDHWFTGVAMFMLFTPIPLLMPYSVVVPVKTCVRHCAVGTLVVLAAMAAVGVRGGNLLTVALILAGTATTAVIAVRPCAWTLAVMWDAENNRDVRTRLAVAEERLRFGRDLHDVMGRNLAVIALKSELAVQLARRGRPEAIDQMTEVQRIARESQREVREVVRGYREAELGAELAGAQGVLTAAGIRCEVTGSAAGLPLAVHSALAWVVRECTTNVLRHSEAAHCKIALSRKGDRVLLTIENDGLLPARGRVGARGGHGAAGGGPEPSAGTGLKGLRERLYPVEGTLTSDAVNGRFRVEATVLAPSLVDGTTRPGGPAPVLSPATADAGTAAGDREEHLGEPAAFGAARSGAQEDDERWSA